MGTENAHNWTQTKSCSQKEQVGKWFKEMERKVFNTGQQKLMRRMKKCIDLNDYYVDK